MKKFYVYTYFDPTKQQGKRYIPFYVGKGCNGRYRDISTRKHNRHLYNKIQKLRRAGYRITDITRFERKDLLEHDALNLEKKLISLWGRVDDDTGILLNATDGGDGVVGVKPAPMLLEKKDEIFQLYDEGKTFQELAKIYRCKSITPVLYLFQLFDKKRRPKGVKKPNVDAKAVMQQYKQGASIDSLRQRFGCDRCVIKKILEEYNIAVTDGRRTSPLRGGRGKIRTKNEQGSV